MIINNRIPALQLAVIALLASPIALAASKTDIDSGVVRTLEAFDGLNSRNAQLEASAQGVLIFPQVTKAGVGVGGEHGDGVLQVKGKTVGYYSVTSASVGLTLGVGQHSDVILFTTQEALDKFTNSHGWSVGADTAVALDTKGAARVYTPETLAKPVLAFVFGEKGLLADASLEGSKVNQIIR
jgi:lipid-binding SYLF domain-containing protein